MKIQHLLIPSLILILNTSACSKSPSCEDFGINESVFIAGSIEEIRLELQKIPKNVDVNSIKSNVANFSNGKRLPDSFLATRALLMHKPSIEKYKLLLDAGFDINHEDLATNRLPLGFCASTAGNAPECVPFLLDSGAFIDQVDGHTGQTALIGAVFNPKAADIVPLLVSRGANVNLADNRGQSPLTLVSQFNQTDSIRLFIEAGANVNHQEIDGSTPLIKAAHHGSPKAFRLLIEAGADVNIKRKDGQTALSLASRHNKHPEVVTLLTEAGSKP